MNERDLFIAALEIEDSAGRGAYLAKACGDDAELRQRVEALLAALGQARNFMQQPAAAAATSDVPAAGLNPNISPIEEPGAVIGPYKLVQQIGEGGMGTVWMAQQTEPVKRMVALKVIKAGMDSKQVIARFEAERQALALMEHPNIARALDAGTTSAGRPYFVMDLVKGVPITRYCDEHHLTPRQRLELFIPVCQAIQHAHQKGIIHRDLKPSNVLVALYDGRPVPKVIDFGVAKAAGQPLTEKTLVTGFGNIVGTLEYMSPEQAEINQLDIDTRSDIYSLGVLLYELLTGTPPFGRKELEKAGMVEMLRMIREQEPSKPSTKLSTAEGLPTLAANRGMEPARLTRLVRGELDWIVMKALEKDRNRRYETANGFALDVQRYLADEPVLAGPPSAWYRFRKFARRNRPQLALVAVLGLLLLGAGGFAWHVDRQAAQQLADEKKREGDERARLGRNAEAVAALLQQCEDGLRADRADQAAFALSAAERRAAEGGVEELKGRLERCRVGLDLLRELDVVDAQRFTLRLDLKDDADRRRTALARYGMTAPDGGSVAEAAERVKGSLIRDRVLTSLDQWLANDPSPSVRALLQAADADPYRDAVRDAVLAKNRRGVKDLVEKSEALAQPARFAVVIGRLDGIPEERRRAVLRSALRTRPGDLFLLLIMAQTYPDGRPWAAERVRWLQAAVAAHPENATARNNLGSALDDLGDPDGAIPEFHEAIRLDTDPKTKAAYRTNLGLTLVGKRNFDGAIAEFQEAARLDPKSGFPLTSWGSALAKKKDGAGALAKYREAIKIDPKFAEAHSNLASALSRKGDLKGAIIHFEEAIRLDPKRAASPLTNWGVTLWRQGDVDGALAKYEEAIQVDPNYSSAHSNRGVTLWKKGDKDAAMAEFLEALRLDPESDHAHGTLGIILHQKGDLPGALDHLQKAARFDPEDIDYPSALALVLSDLGRVDEAIAQLEAALKIDPNHFLTRNNFLAIARRHGKMERALPLYQLMAAEAEKGGFKQENAESVVNNLIASYERLKQFDQAESWRRKWLAVVKEKSGGDSLPYAAQLGALGRNLLRQDRWTDAEAVLRECLDIRTQKAKDSWTKFDTLSTVGGALLGRKKFADAEPLLLEGYEGMKQREKRIPPNLKRRLTDAAQRLVQFYDATKKEGEAAKWRAIRERHEGIKVGSLQEVGDGLKLHGKLDAQTTTLVYEVKLSAGKTYVIDMVSPDQKALDPYLVLQDADGRKLADDDDGGDNLNARITYSAPRDGVYRILATTFDLGRGDFTLTVGAIGAPQKAEVRKLGPMHDVGAGLKLLGKLDAQTTTLVYVVKLTAGKTYVIDMMSPNQKALDPYLVLQDANRKVLVEDDDGGEDLNARITYRALKDGVYHILATSYNRGRGEFTLTVSEEGKGGGVEVKDAARWIKLGTERYQSKDLPGAADALKKAVAIDPQSVDAWNRLGTVLNASKDFPGAVDAFKKAIAIDSQNAIVWYNLGIALGSSKDVAGAIDAHKKAIAINEQYAGSHNSLAWLLATCADAKLRNPGLAFVHAKKAVELAPRSTLYSNTLGVAYYRTGDAKAAIAALEKSMELRKGGDSFDWFFLALAHQKMGDKDTARAWYDRAVQWMDKHQPLNEELRRFRAEASELLELKGQKQDK